MNRAKNAPLSPKLIPNLGLKSRNTFGLEVSAERAFEITQPDQIPALMDEIARNQWAWRVLGGGSNVILPPVLSGATLLMNITGQEVTQEDVSDTYLLVGAGVNWHELVQWTLTHNLPGLENLALIPGTVGATPIQNIGAYGVEVAQYIESVTAFDTQSNTFATLSNKDCQFAYRDSHFKQNPNQYIVTEVLFKFPKAWQARVHYADLAKYFADQSNTDQDPSPQEIFDAVCQIRTQKLPDPKVIGNAGSFFQNPIVSAEQYNTLIEKFPNIVSYPDTAGKRKLAAGWLIDQCGFKGKRLAEAGVYEKQALVIVNHGEASASDILNLARQIQEAVQKQYGVTLDIEPNIL
ncbi:UDP-N-acetylmuramate dehydrogenase [Polynucleobacter sp. 15G-AUS-farblos]|uniref:UDP-N-acetylmuramate dehydrogenase n=1 Tax=Polynucleobacter sp. 15G-AUS-farblos TaxID=2689094 RepID=UPI001C0B1CEF|nr:UDP-N-acetylmuramate dehydrogenase [Polynucleobacter sp. 15G-AUS-farblos]MBU3583746.1 UDP-N-acetylmuramate dehydrogenase [Polynucleobacter sp. 15G-AUS-farblos]